MVVTLEITKDYGYVVLILYIFFNFWMVIQVGKARRKYKVSYSTLYAIKSENKEVKLFNCIQRGHQNTPEMMSVFFVTLLLTGLYCPSDATGLVAFYTVARYFYFKGYAIGVLENMLKIHGLNFLALLGLMILAAVFGVRLLS